MQKERKRKRALSMATVGRCCHRKWRNRREEKRAESIPPPSIPSYNKQHGGARELAWGAFTQLYTGGTGYYTVNTPLGGKESERRAVFFRFCVPTTVQSTRLRTTTTQYGVPPSPPSFLDSFFPSSPSFFPLLHPTPTLSRFKQHPSQAEDGIRVLLVRMVCSVHVWDNRK